MRRQRVEASGTDFRGVFYGARIVPDPGGTMVYRVDLGMPQEVTRAQFIPTIESDRPARRIDITGAAGLVEVAETMQEALWLASTPATIDKADPDSAGVMVAPLIPAGLAGILLKTFVRPAGARGLLVRVRNDHATQDAAGMVVERADDGTVIGGSNWVGFGTFNVAATLGNFWDTYVLFGGTRQTQNTGAAAKSDDSKYSFPSPPPAKLELWARSAGTSNPGFIAEGFFRVSWRWW